MSMWKMDLDGFPPQWLDVADRFEQGRTRLLLDADSYANAQKLRFEWYAFKRKMRAADGEREVENRMYPTLPRIKAEIGVLANGQWVLKFSLRDMDETARKIDAALACTDEEIDERLKGFVSARSPAQEAHNARIRRIQGEE